MGKAKEKFWNQIKFLPIKNHFQFVNALMMDDSNFFVAFGNIMAIYDLRWNKWAKILIAEKNIVGF